MPVAAETCEDCGATEPRTSLGGVLLCDRCTDRRVAVIMGYPELPDPPPPLEIVSGDGRRHVLNFRIWRAPTGIEVELEEAEVPVGEGYHFAVVGAHDANIEELVTPLRGADRSSCVFFVSFPKSGVSAHLQRRSHQEFPGQSILGVFMKLPDHGKR
jgi:hypothetical protein